MGNVRRLRLEELRIETGLRLHMNPGAILEPAAILLQSVNGTANGPVLVLYTPAVTFTDCTRIAVRFRIVSGLVRLCHNSAVADGLRWSDCAGIWLAGRRTEG